MCQLRRDQTDLSLILGREQQIKGGGLKVNDTTVTDEKMILTPAALTPEGVIKLSLGKKRHILLKPA